MTDLLDRPLTKGLMRDVVACIDGHKIGTSVDQCIILLHLRRKLQRRDSFRRRPVNLLTQERFFYVLQSDSKTRNVTLIAKVRGVEEETRHRLAEWKSTLK